MQTPSSQTGKTPFGEQLLKAIVRSAVSTVIIGSVAVGAFAVFHGYCQLAQLREILRQNSTLLGAVFTCLLVWNCWCLRRR